ncbi:hypothetical protein BCR32DRAFT_35920 [Anaeromyces robustus]|uniref:Uncharacterized protein n=1 Tax=Anaeromyces robustus TaxID=1754192 RepID=A0A1Y1XLQ0_9FUNG|nr:hypothetical protein BCR32DRAFT_35920 [Anaeromyces robustus]|eukprot:ORX86677.1 hypothetical protein BCR32DRAFT_35920 [Anaeromyces robustus]
MDGIFDENTDNFRNIFSFNINFYYYSNPLLNDYVMTRNQNEMEISMPNNYEINFINSNNQGNIPIQNDFNNFNNILSKWNMHDNIQNLSPIQLNQMNLDPLLINGLNINYNILSKFLNILGINIHHLLPTQLNQLQMDLNPLLIDILNFKTNYFIPTMNQEFVDFDNNGLQNYYYNNNNNNKQISNELPMLPMSIFPNF